MVIFKSYLNINQVFFYDNGCLKEDISKGDKISLYVCYNCKDANIYKILSTVDATSMLLHAWYLFKGNIHRLSCSESDNMHQEQAMHSSVFAIRKLFIAYHQVSYKQ